MDTNRRTDCDRPPKDSACAGDHSRLPTVDGPFTESKEVIGGYAVLEADSKEEARALIERFLAVHGDEWELECEVRPLDGEEFGE